MKYTVQTAKSFEKELKRLSKRYASMADDYERLLDELEQNPLLGTSLGGGIRKIRMRIASKGKGKRGGARVITFTVVAIVHETEVNLLYIYDKSERNNLTDEEIQVLLAANGLGK